MSAHLRGVKPQAKTSKDALTKAPPVPEYFSTYAAAEWKRIMPRLIKDRVLTKADLAGSRAPFYFNAGLLAFVPSRSEFEARSGLISAYWCLRTKTIVALYSDL